MTVVLKVETKTSLHEPLEIELDGVRLPIRPITLEALERIQDLQADLTAGSAKAIREALGMLVDGDIKPLLAAPIGKVTELILVLIEKSIKAGTEEKNGSGPGDKPSP
ncbi:MAG: hypothetical protein IMZ46_02185 [Acidobacteria bacterium]|nr:hypothetical protein [Acidobacteriota bacterium]